MQKKFITLGIGSALSALPHTQLNAAPLNELVDFEKLGAQYDKVTSTTPNDSQDSLFNGIELTTGSDKKNASFKWAPNNGANGFSITATVPLDSENPFTDFYNSETDVFANASELSVTYRKTFIPKLDLQKSAQLVVLCNLQPQAFGFTAEEAKKGSCVTGGDLATLVDKLDPDIAKQELTAAVNEFVEQQKVPIIFWGATGTYGREKYEYFDDNAITKSSDTKHPYSVSVFRSFLKPDDYMFTVALEYQKGYDAKSAVTRCPTPDSEATFVNCLSTASGMPEDETNKNIKLTYRTKLKDFSQPVALSLEITYDIEDDGTTVSLPVYLFGDKDGLNAGVRYDYESGDTGSSFSLFVGSRFTLSN